MITTTKKLPLLAEITEATLGIGVGGMVQGDDCRVRQSARALLKNAYGQLACQYLENYYFHKLPGGGVESGESVTVALQREIKEEVGCACRIIEPLGIVIEYRAEMNLVQISYGFAAEVEGVIGTPTLEPAEIAEGQITLWSEPAELLQLLEADQPLEYKGQFILARERALLEAYLTIL